VCEQGDFTTLSRESTEECHDTQPQAAREAPLLRSELAHGCRVNVLEFARPEPPIGWESGLLSDRKSGSSRSQWLVGFVCLGRGKSSHLQTEIFRPSVLFPRLRQIPQGSFLIAIP
jgi:hypothetical protein